MNDLRLSELPLAGLFALEHKVHEDERGRFARLFCAGSLEAFGQPLAIRQINHSRTRECGTVRGLHFQRPPHTEAKLITCLRGAVWDVAVDVRAGSPTFLHWHSERLEAGDGRSLWLPPGIAHGFQVLTDEAELLYLHSADYTPGHEGALSVMDPRLAIAWPMPVKNLSPRDAGHPLLSDEFQGVRL